MFKLKSPDSLKKVEIHHASFHRKQVSLSLLRLDLIHPLYGGNKYYKLKYNLEHARQEGHQTILTYGGAFSNHIYATAALAAEQGFNSIGVIRGEETLPLNDTLAFAQRKGMRLIYLNRRTYKEKYSSELLSVFKDKFGPFYLIPEGGSNVCALRGCKEIPQSIEEDYDYWFCPTGTGGTLAGISLGLGPQQKVMGIAVLRAYDHLQKEVHRLLAKYAETFPQEAALATRENWEILSGYEFGGYAKTQPALAEFIENFQATHSIPIEWIYTGKMLYAIFDLIDKDYFPSGSRLIALHTGGIRPSPPID